MPSHCIESNDPSQDMAAHDHDQKDNLSGTKDFARNTRSSWTKRTEEDFSSIRPTKQLGVISKCLSWYYTEGNLHVVDMGIG
jgi:hypothetical protein